MTQEEVDILPDQEKNLAVVCYDFHKRKAEWDHREDLRGKHYSYWGAGFDKYDETSYKYKGDKIMWGRRYFNAISYVGKMNDEPYTAGFYWQIIPFTQEAFDEFEKYHQEHYK